MTTSTREVKNKVDEYFGDTSRTRAATLSGLNSIRDHIDSLIDSLHDAENEEDTSLEDEEDNG